MGAIVINGKELSIKHKDQLKVKVEEFKKEYNKQITLAVILVGNNPASQVYVANKIKSCEYVGIKSLAYKMGENSTQQEVEELVKSLATDANVDGILVQLPLPKHINESKILSLIPSSKDVDGFMAENIGNLAMNKESVVACTPLGVMKMIESVNYDLTGKNAVVIGRSNIVGKPMALLLLNANATVTVCHSKTQNLTKICKEADVIIAALGRPNFVKKEMVKEGAMVIDVGINRVDGKLVGDVAYEEVSQVAGYISPVPGGVGPMTIAMLMNNVYQIALEKAKNEL